MTEPRTGHLDRRQFPASVTALAGAAALAQLPVGRAVAAPRSAGGDYPFTLGVASGDPTPDGVVLWTRLAPQPFQPFGGMPRGRVPVDWQVASDEGFTQVVRDGTAWALGSLAHSVHVEVQGLEPDSWYFCRFRYRGDVSPVGRTRTAPPPGATVASLVFGFASCQDWASGYYPSYRHMAARPPPPRAQMRETCRAQAPYDSRFPAIRGEWAQKYGGSTAAGSGLRVRRWDGAGGASGQE